MRISGKKVKSSQKGRVSDVTISQVNKSSQVDIPFPPPSPPTPFHVHHCGLPERIRLTLDMELDPPRTHAPHRRHLRMHLGAPRRSVSAHLPLLARQLPKARQARQSRQSRHSSVPHLRVHDINDVTTFHVK